MSAVETDAVLPTVAAGSALVRWRKLLLRRRQEIMFISQSFEKLWNGHFPHHDFVTLQLKRPAQRLDRLLSNDIPLDAAYRELNAPEDRPTPQVTVEAIFHAVRERGLAVLKEPATRERLARCDAAALEQIDPRISRLKASV